MALSTALYAGVSGLNADGTALSIIGNDVANSNTVGYKGAIASFSDILSSSLAGGSQVGRGVQLQNVEIDTSQGTLQTTSDPLDMAIQGDGYFIVRTNATSGSQYYTRAGQFSLNSAGYIVDPNGNYLQGKLAQQSNSTSGSSVANTTFGAIGSINVAALNSPPKATGWNTGVQITANLNSATGLNTSGTFVDDPTVDDTFTINSSNNTIEVNGQTLTIPADSYSGPTLAAELQTLISGISPGATVSYSLPQNATAANPGYMFTITNAGLSTAVPPAVPLNFAWASSTAASILGFNNNNTAVTIGAGNDTIIFNDGSGAAGNPYTATIAAGTYNGNQLAAAVQTALNGADNSADNFTVSYDLATNSLTITNTNAANNAVIEKGGTANATLGLSTAAATNVDANSSATADLTTQVLVTSNNASATAPDSATSVYQVAGFDPNNAAATSDFSTSVTVYDSLGNSHLIDIYFKKVSQGESLLSNSSTTGNRWMYWAVIPGTDTDNTQAQVATEGFLEFNTAGALYDVNGTGSASALTYTPYNSFNFSGGVTQAQQIVFDFGQGTAEKETIAQGGSGLTGTTQYGSANSILNIVQDGYASGSLQSINISQGGIMTGTFTNGQTQNIAQIVLARFNAESSLTREGSNLFGESTTSGGPIISSAGTSGLGTIYASSLEASNVDLATEFVNMITVQRGYEANAKVVTVTDELLSDLNQAITT